MTYLVYAVQAIFSSVFSMSSRDMPKPSQYVKCRFVSLSMWSTIPAA